MHNDDEELLSYIEDLKKIYADEYSQESAEASKKEKTQKVNYKHDELALDFNVGYDDDRNTVTLDLIKAPHMLICGKSTHWALINILYQLMDNYNYVDKVDFVICGNKEQYKEFDNLSCVINDITDDDNEVCIILQYVINEMERRFELMSDNTVRNISEYNGKYSDEPRKKLKRLAVVIDGYEKLRLINPDVASKIMRLTQKSRAAGIHLIIGVTNADAKLFEHYVLGNIPVRLASLVKDKATSVACIDKIGAEKLNDNEALLSCYSYTLQKLTLPSEPLDLSKLEFFHSGKNKSKELAQFLDVSLKEINPPKEDLLRRAREAALELERFYTTTFQRKMKISYYKACNLLNQLMREGVIARDGLGKPYYAVK